MNCEECGIETDGTNLLPMLCKECCEKELKDFGDTLEETLQRKPRTEMQYYNYAANLPGLRAKLNRLREANAHRERIEALKSEIRFWEIHEQMERMSFGEASAAIDRIAKNGWKRAA